MLLTGYDPVIALSIGRSAVAVRAFVRSNCARAHELSKSLLGCCESRKQNLSMTLQGCRQLDWSQQSPVAVELPGLAADLKLRKIL